MSVAVELPNPPNDGITAVEFCSDSSDQLLVSSWDAHVHLYDGAHGQQKRKVELSSAVLDCCFGASAADGFAAGLDHSLTAVDFETGTASSLGAHDAPVKCVAFSACTQQVVSASWDRSLRSWDPRAATAAVASAPLPGKAFTMGVVDHHVIVGTSERHVLIFDLRKLSAKDIEPEQQRTSSLKFQVCCCCCCCC